MNLVISVCLLVVVYVVVVHLFLLRNALERFFVRFYVHEATRFCIAFNESIGLRVFNLSSFSDCAAAPRSFWRICCHVLLHPILITLYEAFTVHQSAVLVQ